MRMQLNPTRNSKLLKTLLITTVLAGGATSGFAQEDDSSGGVFADQVIVTAQKKEEDLQTVGISVSSFTGEQAEALGWDNSLDLASQTPSLISTSNAGDAANVSLFSIRGVSQTDFAEGQEAPVALYRDEAYISSPGTAGIPIFDLNRIETLRGPQGTLYGRNTTGGLVHFISNRPTDEFEGNVAISAGEFGQFGAQGVLSGPIAEALQGRLSVYYNRDDGYVINPVGPNGRADDTFSIRGQLNYDINDDTSFLLIGQFTDIRTTGSSFNTVATRPGDDGRSVLCQPFETNCGVFNPNQVEDAEVGGQVIFFGDASNGIFDVANGFVDDGDGDVFTTVQDLDEGFFGGGSGIDRETFAFTGIFKGRLTDSINFTSVTDYNEADKTYVEDTDGVTGNFFFFQTSADIQQFSQEIRFDGDIGDLNWIAGAYYLNIQNEFSGSFPFPGSGFSPTGFEADQSTETVSAFGQFDYALTDTITFTGGFRWTNDDKDFLYNFSQCDTTNAVTVGFCPVNLITDPFFQQAARDAAVGLDPTIDPTVDAEVNTALFEVGFGIPNAIVAAGPTEFDRSDTLFSGKAQIDWQVTPDHLVYASWSRGTKGGGFNAPLDGFVSIDVIEFDPEVLTSYEAGFKSTFLDGAVRLNASGFYYDYEDYQAFFFSGATSFLVNAEAEFFGGEAELTISPGNGLDILAGISLLDTQVNGEALGIILDDEEAPLAPNFTANALVRKAWDLPGGSQIAAQVSGNYVGSYFFNIANSPGVEAGDFAIFDASISLTSSDNRWEFSIFSNNFTNTEPLQFGFDITPFNFTTIQTFGPPRRTGAKFKVNF